MMSGARDILIKEHLDLTDLALAYNQNWDQYAIALGEAKPSTRSIRVRNLLYRAGRPRLVSISRDCGEHINYSNRGILNSSKHCHMIKH